MGAHFARLYAAAGAAVVVGARRIDRVAALADEINGAGGRALAVALDVTDEASIIAAFDAAEAAIGVPDVVVANAGFADRTPAADLTDEIFDRSVQAMQSGFLRLARAAAPHLHGGWPDT